MRLTSYLWQRCKALLLDLPEDLILLELETLLHVQLRNPDPDEDKVRFSGTDRLVVHLGGTGFKTGFGTSFGKESFQIERL